MITRKKLIRKYLEFFESKKHKSIPSASLIPERDPTVLFTTAGMHPLVPYLLGLKHPLGNRLVNVQKCIRTGDIEEIGDAHHHTFFEMLGNWSLGDYFKKKSIEYSFEFLTKILKIPVEKLAVSVFEGDKILQIPKDNESVEMWMSLGIPEKRIAFLGKKDNWWGPAGETGPCGPDTEIFYWKNSKIKPPKKFNPNDKRWVEIWNNVLMGYVKDKKGNYKEAIQKNIDTGMGVERTVAILNRLEDDYLTDSFKQIIEKIEKISNQKYNSDKEKTKSMRVIADHIKASVFILAEGVIPSNIERGYVLRKLIRITVRHGKILGIKDFTKKIAESVFKIYDDYIELKKNKKKIMHELEKEENKFEITLEKGLKQFAKVSKNKKISGKEAFLLYQSYGFPVEMIEEESRKNKIKFDKKDFEKEQKKHQELSRITTKGKFSAGLADNSTETTRYHTATHLLHKALKIILGDEVRQMGSNITKERLRFDFNFSRKLTEEEIKEVENLVNQEINKNLSVNCEEIPYEQAVKSDALSYFREKYPKIVKVYTIGDFSKEICTGPHVKNTKELGKFKIVKEESSSSGIRRIKAVLK